MTVIKDSNGKPLVVVLMSDDDNSLPIVKCSNKSKDGIKSFAYEATGANYNIAFSLGDDLTGQIHNVNLDAEIGSTQTVGFEGLQSYGGNI